ncbi:MAG: DUF1801 domain-containing protein [Candidatus Heimdallarchaeota archaeon]|nr:MAG: DUF1801 domain-containing protein [Candidatus Heimdallarchaeota archaeon]
MSVKNKEVYRYIYKLEPTRRKALNRLRELIFEVAPEAKETIKYKMPSYELEESSICHMASKKNITWHPI